MIASRTALKPITKVSFTPIHYTLLPERVIGFRILRETSSYVKFEIVADFASGSEYVLFEQITIETRDNIESFLAQSISLTASVGEETTLFLYEIDYGKESSLETRGSSTVRNKDIRKLYQIVD